MIIFLRITDSSWKGSMLPYSWFFSRYLNSANGWFSVFSRFYFHEWVCQKLVHCNGQLVFFEGLNFTNDQHSWNLRTSKKPSIRYVLLQISNCCKLANLHGLNFCCISRWPWNREIYIPQKFPCARYYMVTKDHIGTHTI